MNEKEFRESLGIKDEVIYHYCSIEALYGILSSKAFWLTSLESSNDSMELKVATKTISCALNELKSDYKDTDYESMFRRIEEAPKDQQFKKFRPKFKYYGLSLVEHRDSLTHWERYTNNSAGVSIGINVTLIKHLFTVYSIPEILSNWLQTTKILYSEREQINYAKASIMSKIEGFNKMTSENMDRIEHVYSSIYYTTLSTLKPRFKHFGFASEDEHRVYLEEGEAESTSKYFKSMSDHPVLENEELFINMSKNVLGLATELDVLKKDLKHGVFRDGIRSYYVLKLKEVWSDVLIQEIVLGPKCYQNKKELKSFLKSCGLDRTKVSVSKIPLR